MAKGVTYLQIIDLKFPRADGEKRYLRFGNARDFTTVEWRDPDDAGNPTQAQCDALWSQVGLELRVSYAEILAHRFLLPNGFSRYVTIRDTLDYSTIEWRDPADPANPTKEQCDAVRAEVDADRKLQRHERRCRGMFFDNSDRGLRALEVVFDVLDDLLAGREVTDQRIARLRKMRTRMQEVRDKAELIRQQASE